MNRPNIIVPSRHLALAALALVLLCSLLAGCVAGPAKQGPIRDLLELPQDPAAYLDPATAELPLIPPAQSQALAQDFLKAHFSPWHRSWPAFDGAKVFAELETYDSSRMYGETRQLRPEAWLQGLRRLSAVDSYPNARLRALSVVNTSMRVLPTAEPAFQDFNAAGEGYPFDYLQNTAVWAQTPLFVSHYSADKAWALCESRAVYGWVPVRDIALVDDAFVQSFEQAEQLTFTADRVPLHDDFGQFRFEGRVGMLLPLIGREDGAFQVLVGVRDAQGRAGLASSSVPQDAAADFPLAPTPANLALLSRGLMGQPYGWGGMYGHRDCSSMVQDLFTALGVALPRNSSQQAKAGRYLSLEGLSDKAKAERIVAQGLPWRTLLWKSGHIMLYIGQYQGRPMILHTTWGVKTKAWGREGRRFIGATVITTLTPGWELGDLDRPDGLLLHKLRGMTFLPR